MTTLNQGQTASLVLAVGDVYTISSAGVVTVRGIYGAPSATTTITASFGTFGPYSAPAKLDVVAVSGSAEYAIAAGQSPASVGVAIDGAIVDAAQAPAAGVGVYVPSSGNFAGINMLWNGSVWRMQFAPGINVGMG